jgi:hypothetical protein
MTHIKRFNDYSDNLYIGQSKIDGEGLFTKIDIPKKVIIAEIADLSDKTDMSDDWINKFGHKINHSDNPNIETILIGNKFFIKSLRDIEPNEELVDDYTKIDKLFNTDISGFRN